MVWEELSAARVVPSLEASTMEEVMEGLGTVMIDRGYAKDTYVDALVERERAFPTGLDINGVGVAIPHTDVSYVIKEGMAIGKLNKPVRFTLMGTDDETTDVSLVFMLSVKDPQGHLVQLQRILEIIQDNEVLKRLMSCDNAAAIIDVIKEKEQSL